MFKFFKQADKNGSSVLPLDDQNHTNGQTLPEVEERVFIESAPSQEPTTALVENNINVLYAFMDRNHEVKGYDDALVNPDASHLTQNLEALKNELIRTLNKVKTYYEDFIHETDFHIQSRARSGMVDMVEELEMKKNIAMGHIQKVKTIESGTLNEEGDCKGILISYTRGFKNGLAAISHHHILSRRF
jgi:hypothetical protein